jgi:hypothetical protein
MKLRLLSVAVLCVVLPAGAWAQGGRGAEEPLTNASVVKLVRAGFKEKSVVAIIGARPANFDLSPDRLVELKKAGVPERVILAMIARSESVDFADDEWDDEMPLGGFGRERGQAGSTGSEPGSVDIFGSSGGSHGRTRTRGGNGGGDTDTTTTGSATVRIVKPPAEAGGNGSQARLERTPTLTNDTVVELVEAGFSEGTIIRRIEQSPVEFDLSAAKLAELRKRRVTEPVIAAMRAAMGDDAKEPARPEK